MDPFVEKILEAKKAAKPRKFTQTWDLSVNLKNIDLKKPENKINFDFQLPHGGAAKRIAVFADTLSAAAKEAGADLIIRKEELEPLGQNKKKVKELAGGYDYFFGEMTVMALVAKTMGTVLGPRGKMPKPIPPRIDLNALIASAKKNVRISVKDNPVIHLSVGNEQTNDEEVAANVRAVLVAVRDKLPKGLDSLRSAYLKLSMGAAVKLEIKL